MILLPFKPYKRLAIKPYQRLPIKPSSHWEDWDSICGQNSWGLSSYYYEPYTTYGGTCVAGSEINPENWIYNVENSQIIFDVAPPVSRYTKFGIFNSPANLFADNFVIRCPVREITGDSYETYMDMRLLVRYSNGVEAWRHYFLLYGPAVYDRWGSYDNGRWNDAFNAYIWFAQFDAQNIYQKTLPAGAQIKRVFIDGSVQTFFGYIDSIKLKIDYIDFF